MDHMEFSSIFNSFDMFFVEYFDFIFSNLNFSSGIIGVSLNSYFVHFFANLDYVNYLIALLLTFYFFSICLTFSFGFSHIRKISFIFFKYTYFFIYFICRALKITINKDLDFFSQIKVNTNRKVTNSKTKNIKNAVVSRGFTDNYSFPSIDLLEIDRKIQASKLKIRKVLN